MRDGEYVIYNKRDIENENKIFASKEGISESEFKDSKAREHTKPRKLKRRN